MAPAHGADAYHVGALVWAPVKEAGGSVAKDDSTKNQVRRWLKGAVARVTPQSGGNLPLLAVDTPEGLLEGLTPADCPPRNEADAAVSDLVKSDFLHEPGILHTLACRYSDDAIYTYSGNILIAVNPHKPLPGAYGPDVMSRYRGVQLGEADPHVYAIAEQAFHAMCVDGSRQAILISGESGAGKTETAKTVMQYLAARQGLRQHRHGNGVLANGAGVNGHANGVALVRSGSSAPIEQQVLESNPLLEAFGNAKTTRNNNSSRFGKWVEMSFDEFGKVVGASISTYLLERSRVVSVNSPERSFHIFYQLCAGADEQTRQQLRLGGGAASFRYLSRSTTLQLNGVDDAAAFEETREAMDVVGLTAQEQQQVLAVVAAVLHLGNVQFVVDESGDHAELDGGESREAFETVAQLLQVDSEALRRALMSRSIASVDETIVKHLDAAAAGEARDALAKVLYSRLFDWLVAAVNRKISAVGDGGSSGAHGSRSIGILDIYGFESFKENSFEQLCINLANEKLQQQFNATVFKAEQQEYASEGIDWSYVEFVDNQDVLDLLEGGGGGGNNGQRDGVFPLIDEACRLPRASYQDLAHTLRARLDTSDRFVAPKRPQHCFAVQHYAGAVLYSAELLLDKNKDFVVAEQMTVLSASCNAVLAECFAEADDGSNSGVGTPTAAGGGGNGTPSRCGQGGGKSSFKFCSLGASFRRQLNGLMATLNECTPHYIRCIKPNPASQPGSMAADYSLEQLRAGGVLEAVRIATAGFPTRKEFLPFVERYALLLAGPGAKYAPRRWADAEEAEVRSTASAVLAAAKLAESQVGKTRVFLRAGHLASLEGARGRMVSDSAIRIQTAWRGLLARRALRDAVTAAVRLQSAWRAHTAHRLLLQLRRQAAALRAQSAWRMWRCRRAFLAHKRGKAAVVVQKHVRRYLARKAFLEASQAGRRREQRREASIVLQKHWRRHKAQVKVAAMLEEKRKWQRLQQERDTFQADAARYEAEAAQYREERTALQAEAAQYKSASEAAQLQVERLAAEAELAREQLAAVKAEAAAALEAEVARVRAADQQRRQVLEAELAEMRGERDQLARKAADLEDQASALGVQVKAYRSDAEELRRATEMAEAEAASLRKEVAVARDAGNCRNASREATIAALKGELAQAQGDMAKAIADAKRQARADQAARMSEVERQLRMARSRGGADAGALAAARKRSTALLMRLAVVYMRSAAAQRRAADNLAKVEAATAASQAREREAREELETAKKIAALIQSTPGGNIATPGIGGAAGTPLSLSFSTPAGGATPGSAAASASRPGEGADDFARAGLERAHARLLADVVALSVHTPTPVVRIQVEGCGEVGLPAVGWALGAGVFGWLSAWPLEQSRVASERLLGAIARSAKAGGLAERSRWLAACLAAGQYLRTRSIGGGGGGGGAAGGGLSSAVSSSPGRPRLPASFIQAVNSGRVFRTADDFMHCPAISSAVAGAAAELLPPDMAALLLGEPPSSIAPAAALQEAQSLVQSMGQSQGSQQRGGLLLMSLGSEAAEAELERSPWRGVLAGLSAVVEQVSGDARPRSLARAAVVGCLAHLDSQLLAALLGRAEACESVPVRSLANLLAELKVWAACTAPRWAGDHSDVERSTERCAQAVRFLLHGKDDLAARADMGLHAILPELRQAYGSLTLQQLHRLAENSAAAVAVASPLSGSQQQLGSAGVSRATSPSPKIQSGGGGSRATSPTPRVQSGGAVAAAVELRHVLREALQGGGGGGGGMGLGAGSVRGATTPLRGGLSPSRRTPSEDGGLADAKRSSVVLPRKLLVDAAKEMLPREHMADVEAAARQALASNLEGVRLMAALDL